MQQIDRLYRNRPANKTPIELPHRARVKVFQAPYSNPNPMVFSWVFGSRIYFYDTEDCNCKVQIYYWQDGQWYHMPMCHEKTLQVIGVNFRPVEGDKFEGEIHSTNSTNLIRKVINFNDLDFVALPPPSPSHTSCTFSRWSSLLQLW